MAATHSLLRMSFHPALFSIVILLSICKSLVANAETIHGRIIDSQDVPVAHAHLTLLNAGGTAIAHATSDAQGGFTLQNIDPGVYQISAGAPYSSRLLLMSLLVGGWQAEGDQRPIHQIVSASQQVTVTASAPSSLTPDPSQSIIIQDQVLDANPGRPGATISIPGLPIETASGGIKAPPQYFAPGVTNVGSLCVKISTETRTFFRHLKTWLQ